MTSASDLRACLLAGLPQASDSSAEWRFPEPAQIYVPQAHKRALSLEQPLVIGGRGAGKTLWHTALMNDNYRQVIAKAFGLDELRKATITPGFMVEKDDRFPGSLALGQLLQRKFKPSDIWRAVVLRAVVGPTNIPSENWAATVDFVAHNGEEVEKLLHSADDRLTRAGTSHLVVFDALDRVAPESWEQTQSLMRGLLMVALEVRGYRSIRLKLFARPDMIERGPATSFPDASKIVGNPVQLEWSRADLYGLLWQQLGNAEAPHGKRFRAFVEKESRIPWPGVDGYFPVPGILRSDDTIQENLFQILAGPYMGSGPKRGNTYLWLPNHLADERQYVSPRSFIIALRIAAEHTSEEHPVALDWRAIQEGVRQASNRRAYEIETDLPWVDKAMKPLKDLNVPCTVAEIEKRWRSVKVMDAIESDKENLPPPRFEHKNMSTLLDALIAQGMCRRMQDGRINMPDIYRVTYGLGRKGGVPVKR